MLVDSVLAAALLIAGVGPAFAKGVYEGIPVAFGLTVPIVFRRKHPVGAYYTAVAAGGLQVALGVRPAATDSCRTGSKSGPTPAGGRSPSVS